MEEPRSQELETQYQAPSKVLAVAERNVPGATVVHPQMSSTEQNSATVMMTLFIPVCRTRLVNLGAI